MNVQLIPVEKNPRFRLSGSILPLFSRDNQRTKGGGGSVQYEAKGGRSRGGQVGKEGNQ